ncbi:sigma-54-dependent transcriptional regulator [Simiduia aestuariiviva]|uniref:Two-component system response regulator PilR (NtrC family) n=1 Tax=Simiduia aestuariiviva TaxID=1510459 RepID=A0A839UXF3_9GAMM|nr:sigma-54 dependent transcriptional regulator [Simiduia aestuariiviva]MBB3170128.1 two-component system response regulator PilR (NtrC family) [Simiduia aestuariiviva]
MGSQALIVDDEPDILELLNITLSRMGVQCDAAETVADAKTLLQAGQHYDICLTDMRLPDGNGIELVKLIQCQYPNTPVAVITAHGNVDTAIESMKAGAFDFLSKPIDIERLRTLVSTAIKVSATENLPEDTLLVGKTAAMKLLKQQILKLSRSQAPVLISGESGSGKELIARSIHQQGPRADAPFIAVNCGAIPRELMESEFFGHKKGSFTGANIDKAGLFQAAENGTLFLDEVADLPMDMQVKLLRAIQEKAVRPIGTQQELPINVRILSATHKNLQEEIKRGNFRQDLYYRINVIELSAPALRDRQEDIPSLADAILERLASEYSTPNASLSSQAMQALINYSFPGNVRELENILERAYTLCDSNTIQVNDLQLQSPQHSNTKQTHQHETLHGQPLDEHLEEIEKDFIVNALEKTKWNRTEAAKVLGISFRSLRYRLKKLGLE